ncbi:bifunctional diguanylate cyclase/phosphodiesterase [Dechloromonas sp. H13]|uniref:putative bifunctional diguanylate cyclase/phosphodiesterase n=1 Tax=Dechloromonas sp. H13 TaxID=2570193 RepID=UPI0012924643|nr:EAL domain-containing protein [Dechloromonas sp. H13]
MFNLARYFSILSLILIGLAAGLLGLLYREVSVHQMTSLAEDRNVALAQVLKNVLGAPLNGLMAASVGQDASMLQESDESQAMQRGVKALMGGTAVVKIKIYNRLGVTIFSTDPSQVGESSLANPGFKAALGGQVVSDLTRRDTLDTFEGVRSGIDLLATYIPIAGDAKAIEGVLELYQDVSPFMASLQRMLWIVTTVVAAVFALLYLMQLLVVRRAQGILHDQAERIEAARSTLEIQVDARTTELRRSNRQLEDEVAERRQAESKLNYLAYHDPLTGLANRRYFLERLEASLSDAVAKEGRVAVLFIDLDQFKQVNDSLGHGVGDELLVSVSAALCEHVRLIDMIARLGGDEFICVMEAVRSEDEVAMLAQEVIAAFDAPFRIGGHDLFLTASVGISIFPNDGTSVGELLRNADTAMYRAKALGRGHYHFYTPEMTRDAQERIQIEMLLRRALDSSELSVHLQPQVEARSGRLVGAEALVRWESPELGNVPPARFIPLAEDSGIIIALGTWALRETCRQVMRWQASGFELPQVSVNLSVKQLERPEFVGTLLEILDETGIEPGRLKLEITESVVMAVDDAFSLLDRLRRIGISLALDDFGTGYSSLSYLKMLPVQQLKIDRSFVVGIGTNPEDEAIIRSVMALAQSLDFEVVAEGVETAEQAAFLSESGCHQLQGFLHGSAVAPAEFRARWASLPR